MDIFALLCASMVEVDPKLEHLQIKPTDSMRDLCSNSIDRMDVLVSTLEALDLTIPFTELHGPKNLQELADLLAKKASEKTEKI